VGKLANSEQLGYYSLAFRLATLVNEKIGALISRVSFPAFAAMQTDKTETVRHWLSVTRKSALISFPLLAMLAVDANDLVSIILSPKWLPVVGPLRLLCVVGAFRVLTPVVINLLPALGRSDLAFRYTVINATVMPASFFVGCKVAGIIGVGWAWVIVFPFLAFWLIKLALTIIGISWSLYLRNLLMPIAGALAVIAVMLPFLYLLPSGLLRLVCSGAAGCAMYGACYWSASKLTPLFADLRLSLFSPSAK
jgi:PST family polysaccharide transporter